MLGNQYYNVQVVWVHAHAFFFMYACVKYILIVKPLCDSAPPKVINLKIVGEMREGSKVTATSIITGGAEGSSRVQWFKSTSLKFEDENAFEALTTSKVAKVRIRKNNGISPILPVSLYFH
jgi:hypothetical protein